MWYYSTAVLRVGSADRLLVLFEVIDGRVLLEANAAFLSPWLPHVLNLNLVPYTLWVYVKGETVRSTRPGVRGEVIDRTRLIIMVGAIEYRLIACTACAQVCMLRIGTVRPYRSCIYHAEITAPTKNYQKNTCIEGSRWKGAIGKFVTDLVI